MTNIEFVCSMALGHLIFEVVPRIEVSRYYLSIFSAEHSVSVHINQVITIKKHKILAVLSLWLVQYVNYCLLSHDTLHVEPFIRHKPRSRTQL